MKKRFIKKIIFICFKLLITINVHSNEIIPSNNLQYIIYAPSAVLEAPTNLTTITVSSSSIILNWMDNSIDEAGFKIERKLGLNTTYTEITTVGPGTVSYIDNNLIRGTTYYYRLKAYNNNMVSEYTNESYTMTEYLLESPTDLKITSLSNYCIALNWTDNSNEENGFIIERKTGTSGDYYNLMTLDKNKTTYTDIGLGKGTLYYYRIKAYNKTINSGYSNEVSLITDYILEAPVELTATVFSNSSIVLNWKNISTDEEGYKIERKKGIDGVYSEIINLAGANRVTYKDTGLDRGTMYYYRIRVYNSKMDSGYTNEAYTMTKCFLEQPTNLVATPNSNNSIVLHWIDNSIEEEWYKIERRAENEIDFKQIKDLPRNTISYIDNGLITDTKYYYRVRANKYIYDSLYSNEAFAISKILKDDPNSNLKINEGKIKLISSGIKNGSMNSDVNEGIKIYFKGIENGIYKCKIFTLTGDLIWENALQNITESSFNWIPKNIASGIYIVSVIGPGINTYDKIALLK